MRRSSGERQSPAPAPEGDSTRLPAHESYGFSRMCDLMGFPEVWAFERRWAE
jgi:hypothetical protein